MRAGKLVSIGLCLLIFIGTAFGAAPSVKRSAGRAKPQYMPGVVIVKLKPAAHRSTGSSVQSLSKSAAIASIAQRYAATASRQPFAVPSRQLAPGEEEFSRIYELTLPTVMDVAAIVKELAKDPTVDYAEPKYVRHTHAVPNDPMYASQWHLAKILAPQAWDVTKGDSTIVVGIVDSGTDYTHPDLAGNIWINPGETGTDALGRNKRTNGVDDDNNGFIDDFQGWDFVGKSVSSTQGDNDPNPYNGNPHGTHTAGIAAGVTNNGVGIASIGYRTKLMITKHGIDTPGDLNIYNGDDGILYCINNGASIVSCSWGGSGGSQLEADIVKYALRKNVLIVASAGNGGNDQIGDDIAVEPEFPSAYPGVLSVGATNQSDKLPYFSNYGAPPLLKVFAPGWQILSTVPNNGYDGTYSGTSMAAPLAAGLAALVKAAHPTWSAAQLMFQLCGTADNIDLANINLVGKLGFGRINALRAVTETVPVPAPDIAFVSAKIDDAAPRGNGNGILEPGEQANIVVTLENRWGDAANVSATLATTSWAATVTKSSSNYGPLRGITTIDSSSKSNAGDPLTIAVSADAYPTIIPLTLHVTATNGAQKDFTLSLPVLPSVLLVNDDADGFDFSPYFTTVLDSLGVVYEQWEHSAKGTPSIDVLNRYKTVIWSTEWNVPTLDSADRAVLGAYLDGGGKKLFMSGQENGWDLCGSDGPEFLSSKGASKTWYEKYLKGTFSADDAGSLLIKGVAGDEIGDGLSFMRDEPGRGSGQNPDAIVPTGGSSPIFTYGLGSYAGGTYAAGVKYKGTYSLVSLSFGGFESIIDDSVRLTVMDRVLKYLGGYNVSVNQLPDLSLQPYTVIATVTTGDASPTVELLWTVDGAQPYHRVAMSKSTGTNSTGVRFTGVIAPSTGKVVSYFVLVKTTDGFLPYTVRRFTLAAPTAVAADAAPPVEYSLSQNYPNPFNPSTLIRYSVAGTEFVTLTIFDALGREITRLVNDVRSPGAYAVEWNAQQLASGVYYYRLTAGTHTFIKKLTLLR